MKACYYKARDCWRIIVPARMTESGKIEQRYFATKELAEKKIRELTHRTAQPLDLSAEWRTAFGYAIQKLESPDVLIRALNHYTETVLSLTKKATLFKAAELFILQCEHEQLNIRTVADRRRHILELCRAMEEIGTHEVIQLTSEKLRDYFDAMPPGTTRKTKRKNISPFCVWLKAQGYLPVNIMDKYKVPDKDVWGINDEILEIETYRRLLAVTAGLEPIADPNDHEALAEDQEPTDKFKRLLAYYVLRGLAGMRRCELISSDRTDPVIEWTDILWKKELVFVRDEVAKQTDAKDRRRFIPLEPSAAAWLQMVAKTAGPIMDISQSTLQRLQGELLAKLRIKIPENAFRNSYATYSLACRSLGDTAKAVGDLESTTKRHYVGDLLEKADGEAWFSVRPGSRKIVPMREVA